MRSPSMLLLLLLLMAESVADGAAAAAAFSSNKNNVFPSSQIVDAWSRQPPPPERPPQRLYTLNPLYASQKTSTASLSSSPASRFPYLRWKSSSLPLTGDDDETTTASSSTIATTSLWEMQTAVTTFERCQKQTDEHDTNDDTTATTQTTTERLELHAQLHFGDEEYFEYYNSPEFNANRTILYELLVDKQLLMYKNTNVSKETNLPQRLYRVLRTSANNSSNNDVPVISASMQDQATARLYGWTCQVNALALSYTRPNWIHADLTRQEFLDMAALQNQKQQPNQNTTQDKQQQQQQQPLWQVVAEQQNTGIGLLLPWRRSAAATEAATALLVGPPILSGGESQGAPRRLFSNLFLPGTGLVQALRAVLWLMVPSPEISILLLDWSSIVIVDNNNIDKNFYNDGNDSRVRGGRAGGGGLSPISWPVLQALGRGRLDQVRRLIFGQVVLMGATQSSSSRESSSSQADWTLLIQQRNVHAMQVLRETLRNDDAASTKVLLYGCSHCTDLHDQFMKEGFRPVKKEWRTAWSVPIMGNADNTATATATPTIAGTSPTSLLSSIASSSSLMAIFVLVLAYFVIGGLDWIATLQDMALSADRGDGLGVMADAVLYLVRHVLLYLGLSKFLLDWGGTTAMATTTVDASSTLSLDDV